MRKVIHAHRQPDRRSETVGSLLPRVLADLGLSESLSQCQAVLAWEEVAGPQLAQQAKAVRMRSGRLELAVPSAGWRTHLSFSKLLLLQRLNEHLGCRVVRDLVFVNRRESQPLRRGPSTSNQDDRSHVGS